MAERAKDSHHTKDPPKEKAVLSIGIAGTAERSDTLAETVRNWEKDSVAIATTAESKDTKAGIAPKEKVKVEKG